MLTAWTEPNISRMNFTAVNGVRLMTYYKLLDKLNRDEVVRTESKLSYYQFSFGEEKWEHTNIMTDYFCPDSGKCGEYIEKYKKAIDFLNSPEVMRDDLKLFD